MTPVNDAAYFVGLKSKTILEDVLTNTVVVTVIDTDSASSNLVLTATSSDTNLATVAITATNAVSATNTAYTLALTPQTNAFGSLTIALVANDGALEHHEQLPVDDHRRERSTVVRGQHESRADGRRRRAS
jgi:hypothetical protein